jgi:uncharacterized protein (DUF736 family)
MTYDNEMRFVLFRNDKEGNEKRPDYRGTTQVAGVPYKLSGWIKTDKNGKKFLAGQVEPAQPKQQPTTEPEPTEPNSGDDVPF